MAICALLQRMGIFGVGGDFLAILFDCQTKHTNQCYTSTGAAMKANVTLKIDSELLREARILAAEEDSSISALLAGKLEQVVRERRGFQQARERAKARLRVGYDLGFTPPASRDEIYER